MRGRIAYTLFGAGVGVALFLSGCAPVPVATKSGVSRGVSEVKIPENCKDIINGGYDSGFANGVQPEYLFCRNGREGFSLFYRQFGAENWNEVRYVK